MSTTATTMVRADGKRVIDKKKSPCNDKDHYFYLQPHSEMRDKV